jgi:sec-independent protein translocase protein TatB
MLDIGWTELFVIAVVALVVLGPKELPRALYHVGRWTKKARKITGEFQRHIDDIVRQAELEDVKKTVQDAHKQLDVRQQIRKAIDPGPEIKSALDPVGDIRKALGPTPTGSPAKPASAGVNGATAPAAVPAPAEPSTPAGADKPAAE